MVKLPIKIGTYQNLDIAPANTVSDTSIYVALSQLTSPAIPGQSIQSTSPYPTAHGIPFDDDIP